jgi:hypothetical protein
MPALLVLSWSWAVLVAVTGGFDLRPFGLPFKSTNPDRAVYATAILTAAYVYFYRNHARRSAQAFATWAPAAALLDRSALLIVVALSLGTILVGIRQGSLVAEASDAWGYLSQADLWLAGDLVVEQPFTTGMPWPQADLAFSPLGYRPAVHPGAIVPTYPPGLPVLMAAAKAVAGVCGPFLIAPMLGGLTVWLTYLLGVRLSSRLVGLAGAALLVTSPIFVFMVLSPMGDVPATAFFTLGLVLALSSWRGRAFWTGAAVSMAVFIRPNLVLVGAVFLAFVVMRAQPLEGETARRARLRALLWFSLGGAPLVLAVAALNATLYGAPWSGSYGSLGDLYSWRFVWRNLIDYPRWMWATETPLIALALVPVIAWKHDRERRSTLAFLVSFVAAVWVSYLFYRAFGLWLYLRFLLPAIPVLLVVAAWGLAALVDRVRGAAERMAVVLLVVTAALSMRAGFIRSDQLLSHWREGVPYTSVGEYVRRQLPSNAVILTVQHSGSIRYYSGRLTLRWDFLPPEWWPRAVTALVERGYRPYVLVTSGEEEPFRSRFGLSDADDGPGTLVATLPGLEVNRLYDPLRLTPPSDALIPTVMTRPCGCLQPSERR